MWCGKQDLNLHDHGSLIPETSASANSAIPAVLEDFNLKRDAMQALKRINLAAFVESSGNKVVPISIVLYCEATKLFTQPEEKI